jgi:hypothetical protein
MRYLLLIHDDEQARSKMTEAQGKQMMSDYMEFSKQLQTNGNYLAGTQLRASNTATTVKVRDGQRLVTDGPFAETREQLGGYYLIEAKDLDEALAIAARVPSASTGTIEVRPVVQVSAQAGAPAAA